MVLSPSVRLDLRERLQSHLGPHFPIERELGGGGMSRVFLARDSELGRPIVVKVLAPELAESLSHERFRREIHIAAALQHPNILPVLAAGEVDGLPYYTMPFVAGESLAARLAAGPPPGLRDAIGILRGVAQALAYAHEQGVVHRDVKPGNILLSDGVAVVSDFGIAKAIASAWAGSSDGLRSLTGIGVGTAAYAAPEQAIGDATSDHRADIYAFGVVAYEVLAGSHPFTSETPVGFVAAHLTEAPRPLDAVRSGIPHALAALVARCLEKQPGQRPSSAREIAESLAHVPTDPDAVAPAVPGAGRRRALQWGAGLALAAFGGFALLDGSTDSRALGRLGAGDGRARVPLVVADFRAVGADSMLGIAFTSIVRSELEASPHVVPVAAASIASTLERMRRDRASRLDFTVGRELALREAYPGVVDGSISRAGSAYLLSLRLVSTDSGRELSTLTATTADARDLAESMTRLARDLRHELGESSRRLRGLPKIGGTTTSSLEALAHFSAGVRANVIENDQPKARRLLEEAVRLDSAYASAWRALTAVYNNLGLRGPAHALAAGQRAMALAPTVGPLERAEIEAFYYFGVAWDAERAQTAYRHLVELSDTTVGEANYAELLLDDGQRDEAIAIVRAALAHRDTSELLLRHLFRAHLESGRLAQAETTLGVIRRTVPNTARPFLSAVALAHARGDLDGVRAIVDSVERLDRPVERAVVAEARVTLAMLEGAPARAESAIRRQWARRSQVSAMDAIADSIRLAEVDLWVRGDLHAARRRLSRTAPWRRIDALPVEARAYPAAIRALGSAGMLDEARQLRRQWQSSVSSDTMLARRARVHLETADAFLDARATPDPGVIARLRDPRLYRGAEDLRAYEVAVTFDRLGEADSAAHHYAEFVRLPIAARFHEARDGTRLPRALERLSELHERSGNDSLAVAYASRLLTLWRSAEPAVAPRVRAVEARLDRIARATPDAATRRGVRASP